MVRAVVFLIFLAFVLYPVNGGAQRTYAPRSVLASGNWYKLAVSSEGIYRIDGARIQTAGIANLPVPTAGLRLFSKGGQMLGESNASFYVDDLREIAIEVFDGGDGQFNVNDHILFHSPGPHVWVPESGPTPFSFRKNLYSDSAYYYLSIGGVGKRIPTQVASGSSGTIIDRFYDRKVYELDSVNLLSSGQQWFGDELAQAPGKSLVKDLPFNFPNVIVGGQVSLRSYVLARSTGSGSRFDLRLNGQDVGQQTIPPVGTNQYDPFAIARTDVFTTSITSSTLDLRYQYQPGAFGAQGWLDRIEVFVPRALSMAGIKMLSFSDPGSVGPSAVR
ncbi:MAG: type secretion system sortase PorU, partial [Bacteroidota bacterium]